MKQALPSRPDLSSPWPTLPSDMAPLMRREIPDLAAEMVREISHQVPEYDRPGDADYRHTIQRGVEQALQEFVGRVSRGDGDLETAAEVHRAIGRAERRAGRSLDALHSAYRVGARLSWRRWAELSSIAGVPPAQIYRIADAVFAHIDELAEHATEGYAAASAPDDRRRGRLLKLLLTPGTKPEALAEAARAARWPLPGEVVAVIAQGPVRVGADVPREILVGSGGGRPFLLLPAASSWLDQAHRWFAAGCLVVAGPAVPLGSARNSLQLARRCLDLVDRGIVEQPEQGVVRAESHLASVVLLENEAFVQMLIDRHLGPLRQLTPRQQHRMVETLLASLSCRNGAPAVARILNLHPQTVRYRLRRAESLFGDRLRDPLVRLEFEMALRGHQLLSKQAVPA
ncbi:PucR family transcriptional regulator [Cryptosporangium minutisporangium]|uniref:PucR family transcriptional regulator n=1 Tax=Cryptosporangium minutisporangium TaxID=113569 RepID=A0ABP6SVL7_9ACTN